MRQSIEVRSGCADDVRARCAAPRPATVRTCMRGMRIEQYVGGESRRRWERTEFRLPALGRSRGTHLKSTCARRGMPRPSPSSSVALHRYCGGSLFCTPHFALCGLLAAASFPTGLPARGLLRCFAACTLLRRLTFGRLLSCSHWHVTTPLTFPGRATRTPKTPRI